MFKIIGISIFDICAALLLSFALGMATVHADNKFPTLAPGSDATIEQEIIPPGARDDSAPRKEMDYSKNPIIHFDPTEWVQIGSSDQTDKEKETYWLNVKSLDPTATQFVMVGMIQYDKDRIIQGVGSQVRRVFSEAIVECSKRTVYPLRDVYATVDFHLVNLHKHAFPQGLMFLEEIPMFKFYPDAKTKICPKK